MTKGLFRLAKVIAVTHLEDGEDFDLALEDSRARQDDTWWAQYIRGPYSPQRFINWWVARRWVIPRDMRKR